MGKRKDPPPPANDDDENVLVESVLPISFDELVDALRARGADVQVGLITDDDEFLPRAND